MNGLITIAHRWQEWRDPHLVVMVLDNSDLNMVTWEQRVSAGAPKFEDSQVLPAFPYAEFARLLGLHGLRVDRPQDVGAAWDEALRAGRPAVLQMVTDPNVPPLPPHVSARQARNYLRALLHGDPQARAVVMASFREVWDSITRGRH
jgi:pyruvate dehydrogenase (quinone)